MTKDSEVTQAIQKANPYMVEDSVWSATNSDVVVSFPIIPKKGSYVKEDLIGVDHLEKVKLVQQHWVMPELMKNYVLIKAYDIMYLIQYSQMIGMMQKNMYLRIDIHLLEYHFFQ